MTTKITISKTTNNTLKNPPKLSKTNRDSLLLSLSILPPLHQKKKRKRIRMKIMESTAKKRQRSSQGIRLFTTGQGGGPKSTESHASTCRTLASRDIFLRPR